MSNISGNVVHVTHFSGSIRNGQWKQKTQQRAWGRDEGQPPALKAGRRKRMENSGNPACTHQNHRPGIEQTTCGIKGEPLLTTRPQIGCLRPRRASCSFLVLCGLEYSNYVSRGHIFSKGNCVSSGFQPS